MGNQKADAQLTGEESKPLTFTQTVYDKTCNIGFKFLASGSREINLKASLNGGPYEKISLGETVSLGYYDSVSFIGDNPNGFSVYGETVVLK